MQGLTSLVLSKNYTADTADELGSLKGAPCEIQSIVYDQAAGTATITFSWEGRSGQVQTDSIVLHDGEKGDKGDTGASGAAGKDGKDGKNGLGIKRSYVDEYDHFIIVYDDDTTEDCGLVTVVGSTISGLSDVEIEEVADGQSLVYDGEKHKWVNGEGGGSGDASLESAVTSNLAVGAIASGTTLAQGTTFTEFVQKLLITEIAPIFAFSLSKSGNVAYGGSYTETLTLSCSNLGTAKKIKTIAWYEGSTLKQTDTIDSTTTGSWTYTMETATTDTTTFKAIVTYTKSNDADDTQTKQASINFYYNKFYGTVSDIDPTEATVEALTSALATGKGGTYSFTVTAGRICYAYPKSLGTLTSIKDGNGFSLFDSFTRTEQTYTQNGTSVAYYRYVLTDPTTVSGYTVIFA